MFSRRNAFLSWLAWMFAKRVLRRKLRQAVPGVVEGSRRPNKGAIAAGIAAVTGAFFFWRYLSGGDDRSADVWAPGDDH